MTKTRKDRSWDALHSLLHLDEEEIALLASGERLSPEVMEHAAECSWCAEQVEMASAMFRVEPLQRAPDPRRVGRLMDRLESLGAVGPAEPQRGRLRVAFEGSAVVVLDTDIQMRIPAAMATRRSEVEEEPPSVTFFRKLGGVELELHLIRVPRGNFHLVVGVCGEGGVDGVRVILHRGRRELGSEPVHRGTATFKNLRTGSYCVEIQNHGAKIGMVDLEVEGNLS